MGTVINGTNPDVIKNHIEKRKNNADKKQINKLKYLILNDLLIRITVVTTCPDACGLTATEILILQTCVWLSSFF